MAVKNHTQRQDDCDNTIEMEYHFNGKLILKLYDSS